MISPYRERCWFVRGKRPEARINFTRDKFHGIGLLGPRSFNYAFCDKLNQGNFVRAIRKFLAKRSRLVIILDNANWHKGKQVNRLKKERKKTLRLIYLPTYSPELNPMETIVKESKKALSNKLYKNTNAMKSDLRKAYKRKQFFMHKMFKYLCP